jgi:acetoacetate decarboxylase
MNCKRKQESNYKTMQEKNHKEDSIEMKKATFQLPKELAKLNPSAVMGNQKGIYFTFVSDMATIASVVPPPLTPAMPLVSGYITEIRDPAFAEPYAEASLGVYVQLDGAVGFYPLTFLLSGAGAEMATYLGREKTGLPKKNVGEDGCIRLEYSGDAIRGIVERKGVRLMDVSMKLGEYNNPMVGSIYSDPEPGKHTGGTSYYYATKISPDEQGNAYFSEVTLYSNEAEYTYHDWTPGKVSIRLQSSTDDPWGQLPVLENLGGGLAVNDLEMKELVVAARPDPKEVIPYLLSTRFDKSALVKED